MSVICCGKLLARSQATYQFSQQNPFYDAECIYDSKNPKYLEIRHCLKR